MEVRRLPFRFDIAKGNAEHRTKKVYSTENGVYQEAYSDIVAFYSSESVSSSYALSYVLDYFHTGLKIAYRKDTSYEFKEQQTIYNKDLMQYEPSICR